MKTEQERKRKSTRSAGTSKRGIRFLFICMMMLLLCAGGAVIWTALALRRGNTISTLAVPTPHWVHIDGAFQANAPPYEVGVVPEITVWRAPPCKENSKIVSPAVCCLRHGTRVQMVRRVETSYEDAVEIITTSGEKGWVTYHWIEELKYPLPTPCR